MLRLQAAAGGILRLAGLPRDFSRSLPGHPGANWEGGSGPPRHRSSCVRPPAEGWRLLHPVGAGELRRGEPL